MATGMKQVGVGDVLDESEPYWAAFLLEVAQQLGSKRLEVACPDGL